MKCLQAQPMCHVCLIHGAMKQSTTCGCRALPVKAASHHTTESTVSIREQGEHGAQATVYVRHTLDQVMHLVLYVHLAPSCQHMQMATTLLLACASDSV